jgi:RNA polymerase sigma-70 factor (ECF subfamily)
MDYSDPHDLSLLHALDGGQQQAFWTLWLRHSRRLFAVCLREMNGSRIDAEDALHEAMLHAYERLPRFAAEIRQPASWLARMTSNVCRDLYRNRARRGSMEQQSIPLLELSHCAGESVSDAPHPDFDAQSLAALLPSRLRDVFVLRIFGHASYADIASRLGVTAATARKRMQQSRATLRTWRDRPSSRHEQP